MSNRTPLVIANWKLNGNVALIQSFHTSFSTFDSRVFVGVCPPLTLLAIASQSFADLPLEVGSQTLSEHASGAYTGEISAAMVSEAGATFCLVGHSERRTLFGETDQACNEKLKAAIAGGVMPVLCVGETHAQYEAKQTTEVVKKQLIVALEGVDLANTPVAIAYEPVWAIGTGLAATPDMAQAVHGFIRQMLGELFGESVAQSISILYGGSAKKDNAKALMRQPDIDGLLVGGASLDAEHFLAICQSVATCQSAG